MMDLLHTCLGLPEEGFPCWGSGNLKNRERTAQINGHIDELISKQIKGRQY